MSKIVFFSVLSLLLACGPAKQPAPSAQPPGKTKEASAAEAYNLENRIPDCDSALAFMKQVIVPVRSEPLSKELVLASRFRQTFISVPGTGQGMTKEQSKLYLNIDCLVGQPASVAFELFCTEESQAAFLSVDSTLQKYVWGGMTLEVDGLWYFNVVTRDGRVFSSSFLNQDTTP